jgi:hypothetical protein
MDVIYSHVSLLFVSLVEKLSAQILTDFETRIKAFNIKALLTFLIEPMQLKVYF